MRPTTTALSCFAVIAVPILAGGCVPQDRYDALMTTNRSLQEQLVSVEDERDQARTSTRRLQMQINDLQGSYQSLESSNSGLSDSINMMASENDQYLQRITQLELGPLPPDLAAALETLAMRRPDVLTFDPGNGMLRFNSDLTFDLGSVEIKPEAADTIAALASILNDTVADGLEARVVGHTDNVPIGRPETRRLHPTNVHLSVHRAIAVRDALTQAGVDPVRIQVAGYGEVRPMVPNGNRGAAENRRVEIFFAPMPTGAPTRMTGVPTDTPAPTTPTEPMK